MVIKLLKFMLLLDVKIPTIVSILTFISRINTTPESFRAIYIFSVQHLVFMHAQLSITINYNPDSFWKSGLLLHGGVINITD